MKKRLVTALIIISALAAVITSLSIIYHSRARRELCRDENILSRLSDDPKDLDFVFFDKYYRLPCPLSAFLDSGFSPADEESAAIFTDSVLEEGQWREISVGFGVASSLRLVVYQPEKETLPLSDATVYAATLEISLQDRDTMDPDVFVTKYGINGQTGRVTLRKLFQDDAFYREGGLYYFCKKNPDFFAAASSGNAFPDKPLFYLSYRDRQASGWNRIRLSCLGYGFSLQNTPFYTGFGKNDGADSLPIVTLTNREYAVEIDRSRELKDYIREINGAQSDFMIEDLHTASLPDISIPNASTLKTIYLVTEKNGFSYHIFERKNAYSFPEKKASDYEYEDLLSNDRRVRFLEFLFQQFEGEKGLLCLDSGEAFYASVTASYRNREELMEIADEISAFRKYLQEQPEKYSFEYKVTYKDPFTSIGGTSLISVADIEGSSSMEEDLREKFLSAYLSYILAYRRSGQYSEFTAEEIEREKAKYKPPVPLLEEIYTLSSPYSELYSVSAVYEIAEMLGYEPKGTPEHFLFTGKDYENRPIRLEFSYDFIDQDPDTGSFETYYFENGKKVTCYEFMVGFGSLSEYFPEIREAKKEKNP